MAPVHLEALSNHKLAVPLLLAALPIFFFWRLTFLGEVLFWGTPLLQFYPWRDFAVMEYLSGRVPLWNPHVGLGAPLAANLQSGVFYPLNIVYFLLPIERAMTVTLLSHVALAGLFMYAFSRVLGISRGGALVGGVTFMFSGYVVARAGFLSMTSAVAWLPALFLCIEGLQRALSSERRAQAILWMSGLAGATGMALLAGHLQVAYYSLLAAGAYHLLRSAGVIGQENQPRPLGHLWQRGGSGALAVALGAALAAVQLYPTLELSRVSERQAGVPYEVATSFSLWPGQLLGIVFPAFFGSQSQGDWWGPGPFWEGVLYVGVLPVLLALYGGRLAPRRYTLFFAVLAFVGLFLALGKYNPLFPFFFHSFPGFASFQAPARLCLWATFGMAVLAGYGWEAVVAKPRFSGWHLGPVAVTTGIGVLAATILARQLLSPNPALPAAASGGAWLLVSGILLNLPRRRLALWQGGALALLGADLFLFGSPLNPTTQAELYRSPTPPAVEALRERAGLQRIYTPETTYRWLQERYFSFGAFSTTDWEALHRLRGVAMPNLAVTEGLYEVYNYDPLRLERPLLVMRAAERQNSESPLLDMMGVGFLLAPEETGSQRPADGSLGFLQAQERSRSLPRAFIVGQVKSVPNKAAALALIASPTFDPRAQAVVETTTPLPEGSQGPLQAARIVEYGPQRAVIETPSKTAAGLLVLADAYYPGWRAELDGGEVPIWPTNVALRGVSVPAGAHRVVFQYDPSSFRLGLLLSGIAALLLAGALLWALRTLRRQESVL